MRMDDHGGLPGGLPARAVAAWKDHQRRLRLLWRRGVGLLRACWSAAQHDQRNGEEKTHALLRPTLWCALAQLCKKNQKDPTRDIQATCHSKAPPSTLQLRQVTVIDATDAPARNDVDVLIRVIQAAVPVHLRTSSVETGRTPGLPIPRRPSKRLCSDRVAFPTLSALELQIQLPLGGRQ